ncbi:MAG: APC family permease [Bacteroidota bacterium]
MISLNTFVIIILNAILIFAFASIIRKKNFLSYFSGGRWWLTWLSIAIITLMDELTSIFYAPSEAFRFIGTNAIVFIALTSLVVRFMSTRMVEIAEILELHGIRGGGVYSFSYFVLGPRTSFIAFASILVTYVLTACLSTVSAVENGFAFMGIGSEIKFIISLVIIWFVAGLNIIGIRENAKFTFGIFIVAAFILMNLLTGGILQLDSENLSKINLSATQVIGSLSSQNMIENFGFIIIGISSCILAYSGIESVVQTAGLVKSWQEIRKAYIFLGITVGIFTPLIAIVVFSSDINVLHHETDLIAQFAKMIGGHWFGVTISILASLLLMMAVNTAYVASGELIERVAHRYNFNWILKTNRRQSHYRIHILNGIFYSVLILITSGSQKTLAEMYAIGLLASFTINLGSLLIFRYFKGTKDVLAYHTSRVGTLIIFIIFFSSFIYLSFTKPYGMAIWSIATLFFLVGGILISKTRSPEKKHIQQTDSTLKVVLYLSERVEEEVHIFFRRPDETEDIAINSNCVYVSLFSPRSGIPEKISANHFRIANNRNTIFEGMMEMLYTLDYELTDKKIVVHFGWPLSSWIDRLSTGVMVFSIMKLPKTFPRLNFSIDYFGITKIINAQEEKK